MGFPAARFVGPGWGFSFRTTARRRASRIHTPRRVGRPRPGATTKPIRLLTKLRIGMFGAHGILPSDLLTSARRKKQSAFRIRNCRRTKSPRSRRRRPQTRNRRLSLRPKRLRSRVQEQASAPSPASQGEPTSPPSHALSPSVAPSPSEAKDEAVAEKPAEAVKSEPPAPSVEPSPTPSEAKDEAVAEKPSRSREVGAADAKPERRAVAGD